eukprot:1182279-Prorocentrum_minimum.AAC.1
MGNTPLRLAWAAGAVLSYPRRVAFLFMGSQKTESMGVAILTIIFKSDQANLGRYALPVILYHSVQVTTAPSRPPPDPLQTPYRPPIDHHLQERRSQTRPLRAARHPLPQRA